MDKIIITGFPVDAVIGTFPEERKQPQRLIFDLTVCGDFSAAGKTDTLEGTVNYRELEEKLGRKVDLVEEGTLRPAVQLTANRDMKMIYERSN